MTTRDELADLIMDVFNDHDDGHDGTALAAADAILARWRLVPVVPEWSARVAFPHETPIPCYEDDLSRCGCSTCINEPKLPGKRPITEQQRRDRHLTPNVHPPKFAMNHADGCECGYAAQHRAADELTRHDQNAGPCAVAMNGHPCTLRNQHQYRDGTDHQWDIATPKVGDLFRNTATGSVFRYVGEDPNNPGSYTPIMLGTRPARGQQLDYRYTLGMAGPLVPYTVNDGCACGRTDQHGPHED